MEKRIKRLKDAVAHLADIHVQYCNDMDVAMDMLSTEVMELEEDFKRSKETKRHEEGNTLDIDLEKAYKYAEMNLAVIKDLYDMCGFAKRTEADKAFEDLIREVAKSSRK